VARQAALSAEFHAGSLGTLPALASAFSDKLALEFGDGGQHRRQQTALRTPGIPQGIAPVSRLRSSSSSQHRPGGGPSTHPTSSRWSVPARYSRTASSSNDKMLKSKLRRQPQIPTRSAKMPPICDPLQVSPWIAMSLLQKAIRRGRKDLALRATATLLHVSPERLWRRIGCVAFEDIGVADLDAVAMATAALAGKRFRASLGGESCLYHS
jgi:hypothetical protein